MQMNDLMETKYDNETVLEWKVGYVFASVHHPERLQNEKLYFVTIKLFIEKCERLATLLWNPYFYCSIVQEKLISKYNIVSVGRASRMCVSV